ncbi:MAG: hypothetical protein R3B09_19695 [Nannocystaceae bacterium]
MTKVPHETVVQIVRNAPSLILDLIWPERQHAPRSVRITQTEFVDAVMAEYRADDVLLIGDDADAPEGAVVVEVQLAPNPDKPTRWPILVAGPHARYRCPVDLVVVTLDRTVAAWARRPLQVGRMAGGMTLTPLVLGPDDIPVITDLEVARWHPELAVLSALAHVDAPEVEDIAAAAFVAAHDLDKDRAVLYPDAIFARLGEVARTALEKIMQTGRYEFQSDFARKYFAEGEAKGKTEGKAEVLLDLLKHRGIVITDEDRRRVAACSDDAQISAWIVRVLTADSREAVFGG